MHNDLLEPVEALAKWNGGQWALMALHLICQNVWEKSRC